MRGLLAVLITTIALAAISCGPETIPGQVADRAAAPGLGALPLDRAQPWEKLGSQGYIVPAASAKVASAFGPGSTFIPGVERFNEVGNVTDDGDISVVVAGSNSLSGGIYRIPMGGQQPAAIAIDANLHRTPKKTCKYWVAVSRYSSDTWEWHGPFTDAQATLVLAAGGNYLSPVGNTFVAITAFDDAQLDIVGLTVSPLAAGDTTPPPAPSAPSAAPISGGLELSWASVIAGDLAGYRVYWSYSPFTTKSDNGVNAVGSLENTTRMTLALPYPRDVYVALAAVDVDGNESGLSTVAGPFKSKSGTLLELDVTTPKTSLRRGDVSQITASGADLYDFDTDGDGDFDITDSASGTASVDTAATGIIRPRVRAHSSDGTAVAFGSVSLLVSGNQRPVASATADPAYGYDPLPVELTGGGTDFDGTIVAYAWDFNGDGLYDSTAQDVAHTYPTGLYNTKLRVTDDQGAWDVDTVAVQALPGAVQLSASPATVQQGETFTLTATPNQPATDFDWDLDGDGTFETTAGTSSTLATSLTIPGPHTVGVRAVLAGGGTAQGAVPVYVRGFNSVGDIDGNAGLRADNFLAAAMVAGHPAIVYAAASQDYLMYVRATDPLGTTWGTPVLLSSEHLIGQFCRLGLAGGKPVVVCQNGFNGQIDFYRADDSKGTTWQPAQLLVWPPSGSEPALAIVDGNPAVATLGPGSDMEYIRALDSAGASWPAGTVEIDTTDSTGHRPSLGIVNGNPAVCYVDDTTHELKYCRSLDVDGVGWDIPHTLASNVNTLPSALTVMNGVPTIFYPAQDQYGVPPFYLGCLRGLDPNGNSWQPVDYLDGPRGQSGTGFSVSVATVAGETAVTYTDANPDTVMQMVSAGNDSYHWAAPQRLYTPGSNSTFITNALEVSGRTALAVSNAHDGLSFGLAY